MVRSASRSSFLLEHDLFGKPDSTFPDHALVLISSLHHFIARHDAPEIGGGRILRPHLGTLRTVAMPRPRLEIAEFFVHAVELGEGLGDQAVRRAMVGKQIVADAVPSRPP